MRFPNAGASRAAALRERLLFPVLACTTLAACDTGGGRDGGGVVEHHLTRFDTLITTESGLIGVPSDVALAPDGRLWIADRVLHRVLVVDPEDGAARPIGREGAGPGEFRGRRPSPPRSPGRSSSTSATGASSDSPSTARTRSRRRSGPSSTSPQTSTAAAPWRRRRSGWTAAWR